MSVAMSTIETRAVPYASTFANVCLSKSRVDTAVKCDNRVEGFCIDASFPLSGLNECSSPCFKVSVLFDILRVEGEPKMFLDISVGFGSRVMLDSLFDPTIFV